MVSENHYWDYYKLVRDPPGTPETLRCIGCKLGIGAALGTVGLAAAYGAKKTIASNVFIGSSFCFAVLGAFGLSAVSFRMAYEDNLYNERLRRETMEKIRKERQANSHKINPKLIVPG